MSAEIVIARPTTADVTHVAAYMREADRAEVWASGRLEPLAALEASVAISREVWVGRVDDVPVCLFGVGHLSDGTLLGGAVGAPWLLGTNDLPRHAVAFLRRNRPVVAGWRQSYGRLVNCVDARNSVAIRWLRWLGFTIHPAAPWGAFGLPFHRFEG